MSQMSLSEGGLSEDDFGLGDYEEERPWDNTQHSEEEEEEEHMFTSYFQILENLATLQTPDVTFGTLRHALCVVFDHFNDVHSDKALYPTILEKLGCDYEESEECFSVSSLDGKYQAKEAIQFGLHNMAQTIGVLHMSFLKCKDIEASVHQNLTFDSEEINVKLAELYYRQSAFVQRLMVEFDIVHPMATSSRTLLNKAMKVYQEHAAFYKFVDGIDTIGGKKSSRDMDTLFMIYFTIHQLSLRGYRVRKNIVYKEIRVPKRKPVAQGVDAEGFPVYKCCHKDELEQECGILRTKHAHPIEHVWQPTFEVSKTETWNTHFWKPINSKDFYNLEEPTIAKFVWRAAQENGKAHKIIMANKSMPRDVEDYIVRSCTSMVKFLDTKERTYACWNGILVSSKFYPYDELPREFDNISVNKFFPKWYFHEEDERAIRGKSCASLLPSDHFRAYKRPPHHCYEGYVQNLYCKMCRKAHDKVDHSKCGYHTSSSSSSSSSAVPARWTLRCVACKKKPTRCECEGGKPTVYRLGVMRYLNIPTIHWDQLIMTQIKGMTISSPTDKGTRIPLPQTEHLNTYRWNTGLSFRPNFRIGPRAKTFKKNQNPQEEEDVGDDDEEEKSIYADCWRVATVFKGETNTGKSAQSDMTKIYLPEYGNLSDANQGKFMLEQCVERGKFKPILMGEMGPNTLGRTMFCALVDATTVIPVSRKGITDVNAICDRGLTILCNKFRLAGGDVEGSVKSRLAMLVYEVVVPDKLVDGMIHNRNTNDPMPLARKGNWAYEDISSNHGHEHFARACPMIYLENRARFEENANPLRQFLNEPISEKLGPLVIDKDVYMKRKDLIEAFRDHCKLNGVAKNMTWSDDHYNLRKCNIRPAPMGKINDEDGNPVMEKYMYGIAPLADATTAHVLASKNNKPVEDVDEEDGISTFVLIDKANNHMAELEAILHTLVHRDDISSECVQEFQDNLKNILKHVQDMEEMNELGDMVSQIE